ncbi:MULTISPECIES: hypothetical protein [unclassified Sphingopyxis]|uniref:hypothetical protein n=1 Tax=unclassified Sphingopyxis TaxID=2614943 RepID=UPI000AD81A14|nr:MULTISPECIES: hypothetical protein [unclassified Sphingopyxis]
MAEKEHWFDTVESWSITLGEIYRPGADGFGRDIKATHSGSGTLARTEVGDFKGEISCKVTLRAEYDFPHTITEASGSEDFPVSLSLAGGGRYRLGVGKGYGGVEHVTRDNLGKKDTIDSTVPFYIVSDVFGELPEKPGPVSAQLPNEGGGGAATWTLTPRGGRVPRHEPAAVEPTPSPPPKPKKPKPKKPKLPPPPPDPTLRIDALNFTQFGYIAGVLEVVSMPCVSVGTHPYVNGQTPFRGTIALSGTAGDSVTEVVLELRRGTTVVRAQLEEAVRANLIATFPDSGRLEVARLADGRSPRLFVLPSANTEPLVTTEDSDVELRVTARTAGGATAERRFGKLPILVRITGLPRFIGSTRDEVEGGDDWARPSVVPILQHYPGLLLNDCANLHGGPFGVPGRGNYHLGHRDGLNVDLLFEGYMRFDRASAARLIGFLNDPEHGHKIVTCYVEPQAPAQAFWGLIRGTTLDDGRPASAVIRNVAPHHDHFHWVLNPNRAPPRRRRAPEPRRPRGGANRARGESEDNGVRGASGVATPLARRRAEAVAAYRPPLDTVWHLDTAEVPALHFVPECPALQRLFESGSPVTEEPVHADDHDLETLAANSQFPPCGTCRAMYDASLADGRARGLAAVSLGPQGDALLVFADRVEQRLENGDFAAVSLDAEPSVAADRLLFVERPTIRLLDAEASLVFTCGSVEERDRMFDLIRSLSGPGACFDRGGATEIVGEA